MPALRALVSERPAIMRAVLLDMLVEASILREWVTNIGRRSARSRLAHLLCEFACRLTAQGFTGDAHELPMTQEQIGDALGLTSVHVNRSIKALEADGLISRARRHISFPDIAKLRDVGDFSSLYLHLDDHPLLA
jgi:CRP-like cAMP-binding protein